MREVEKEGGGREGKREGGREGGRVEQYEEGRTFKS